MKDNNFEDDFVEREQKKKERKTRRKYVEMEQEKMFLEEITKHLEKKENISDEIFDSFSHELRTPIVTIKSYIDMLLREKFGKLTPEQKIKLIHVSDNTDLLIDVIMKMLEKIKERK